MKSGFVLFMVILMSVVTAVGGAASDQSVEVLPELSAEVATRLLFHVEAVPVSVAADAGIEWLELHVDGVAVATFRANQAHRGCAGESLADGKCLYSLLLNTRKLVDGTHDLVPVARLSDGSALAGPLLEVRVANSLSAIGRIEADFEAGVISSDEYVELGLGALCCGSRIADRYRSEARTINGKTVDAHGLNGTQYALHVLRVWEELTPQTRAGVEAIGTSVGPIPADLGPTVGTLAAGGGSALRAPSGPSDCSSDVVWLFEVGFPVTENTEAFNCLSTFGSFNVFYNDSGQDARISAADASNFGIPVPSGSGSVRVNRDALANMIDSDGDGVPDYVQELGEQLEIAWNTYGPAGIGFNLPAGSHNVVIHDLLWEITAGYTLPNLMQIDEDYGAGKGQKAWMPDALGRHEAFHTVEYGYVEFPNVVNLNTGIRSWMEASAEWATHRSQEITAVGDSSSDDYYRNLAAFLGTPNWSLTASPLGRERSYGAFIMAEYLEENHGGDSTIEETWIAADTYGIPGAIGVALASVGADDAEVYRAFHEANYLLEYLDGDRDNWKTDELDSLGGRPARASYELTDPSGFQGSTQLDPLGAQYIELSATADEVARVSFLANPNILDSVIQLEILPGDGVEGVRCSNPGSVSRSVEAGVVLLDIAMAAPCDKAVVVLSNVDTFWTNVAWGVSFPADAPSTWLISSRPDGAPANGDSDWAGVSADGRYVVFSSEASDLVAGDSNGLEDCFIHDRATGITEIVSVSSGGVLGNGPCSWPDLSDDGRYVTYASTATNLVGSDMNDQSDVFVHDRVTSATTRVSVDSAGLEGSYASSAPSISSDGQRVAFYTQNSFDPSDTGNTFDVYVRNRASNTTLWVSQSRHGYSNTLPQISGNGQIAAFKSDSVCVMVDLTTWTETYVGSNCGGIRLSDDGSVVAYYIPSALGGQIYGGPIGGLDLVSKTPGGAPGNGWSYNPVISPDGRYIGFVSQASDLIADDTNTCLNYPASGQCPDVFVHDLQTSETTRVSVGAGGEQADGASSVRIAALSNAAREVVFRSNATNLVPGDTNNLSDIFIRTNALGG